MLFYASFATETNLNILSYLRLDNLRDLFDETPLDDVDYPLFVEEVKIRTRQFLKMSVNLSIFFNWKRLDMLGKIWKETFTNAGERAILIQLITREIGNGTPYIANPSVNFVRVLPLLQNLELTRHEIAVLIDNANFDELDLDLEHVKEPLMSLASQESLKFALFQGMLPCEEYKNSLEDRFELAVAMVEELTARFWLINQLYKPCPFHSDHENVQVCPYILTDDVRERLGIEASLVLPSPCPLPIKSVQEILSEHDWETIISSRSFVSIRKEWKDLCELDRNALLHLATRYNQWNTDSSFVMERETTFLAFLDLPITWEQFQILLNLFPTPTIQLSQRLKALFPPPELYELLAYSRNYVYLWDLITVGMSNVEKLEECFVLIDLGFKLPFDSFDVFEMLTIQAINDISKIPKFLTLFYSLPVSAMSQFLRLQSNLETCVEKLYQMVPKVGQHNSQDVKVMVDYVKGMETDEFLDLMGLLNHFTEGAKILVVGSYAGFERYTFDQLSICRFITMIQRLNLSNSLELWPAVSVSLLDGVLSFDRDSMDWLTLDNWFSDTARFRDFHVCGEWINLMEALVGYSAREVKRTLTQLLRVNFLAGSRGSIMSMMLRGRFYSREDLTVFLNDFRATMDNIDQDALQVFVQHITDQAFPQENAVPFEEVFDDFEEMFWWNF